MERPVEVEAPPPEPMTLTALNNFIIRQQDAGQAERQARDEFRRARAAWEILD